MTNLKNSKREFYGEFIGTFILVFFGCGALTVTTIFSAINTLPLIALIWGGAVSIAIFAARHLSCAHFNPAVSLAMVVSRRMAPHKLPVYLFAQLSGAFTAAWLILFVYGPAISEFEALHGITRGTIDSIVTARLFGEFYILHSNNPLLSMLYAMFAETLGTFLLVLLIFFMTDNCNLGRPSDNLTPLSIGASVFLLICLFGPLTQAGLNPARDLAPRLVSWLSGWRSAAFPDQMGGFFFVYVLSPLLGGLLATFVFTKIFVPAMFKDSINCQCTLEKRR